MSERLTAAEAAEAIGVHVNTIKHWIGQVSIPAEKDGAGRWRFSPEAVDILTAIKNLRDQDRTFDTIRQRLDKQPTSDDLAAEQQGLGDRQVVDNRSPMLDGTELAAAVTAAVVPSVIEAITQSNELAEKYARAAHQIGTLEATLKAAEAERLRLAETQSKAAAEVEGLRSERDRMAAELADARHRLAQLETATAMQRPWWKLWG